MLELVLNNYQSILLGVASVIAACSVAVHAIAPFTPTKLDDKVDGYLSKAVYYINKLVNLLALNKSK